MTGKEELLDELLKEYKNPEDILGEDGLLKQLTKALVERALEGELTDHLRYPKHSPVGKATSNSRNGKTKKTIQGKNGAMSIAVPRDREGDFEPQLIPKHQRRFDGFDDKIIALYSRGMIRQPAEYPGPIGGSLWCRCVPNFNIHGYGCGVG